jgi:hypothetical protein
MNEKCLFADVELPFHVWVREGSRWVLRDARRARSTGEADGGNPPTGTAPSADGGHLL